jgi:hypothetical protein
MKLRAKAKENCAVETTTKSRLFARRVAAVSDIGHLYQSPPVV